MIGATHAEGTAACGEASAFLGVTIVMKQDLSEGSTARKFLPYEKS
jgi:hypothetical protein